MFDYTWKRLAATVAAAMHLVLTADAVGAPAQMRSLPEVARSSVPPPTVEASAWLLVDQRSGWIIAEHNADERLDPASLSKLMTAYVVFDKLKQGALRGDTEVSVSENAWKTGGSRMFIEVNSKVTISDLLQGLIVQSGNDAAVALAEHIAGGEQGFAEIMNQTAAKLGLTGTQFMNSTGLPDPDHFSTARDITTLASRLILDFPDFYQIYSLKEFTFNEITQKNRNVLLWRDDSVDGVKTGHTAAAGYCLVGSAARDGSRFLATVMGANSAKYRAQAVYSLLQHGFAAYDSELIYAADQAVSQQKVYFGDARDIGVGSSDPLVVTIPKNARTRLRGVVNTSGPIHAPINKGQQVATLTVTLDGNPLSDYPLVTLQTVGEGSWWRSLLDRVILWWDES